MAATASRTPPPRRPVSGSPSPPSNSISKGATARSAVTPRATSSLTSSAIRRSSTLKERAPHTNGTNGTARESLSEALKQETEQKEHLLVQIQNKDQIISNLSAENDNLTSALTSTEIRVNELYTDQSRMEDEMATRMEVAEKLRSQIRDLEKEKRDIQRRYNEQTSSFEAERQSFYDNEQHLKSRIQSLTQARKQSERITSISELAQDQDDGDGDASDSSHKPVHDPKQDLTDPETEPAEMTSLKLELSTLSTSYASLQSTLVLLQTQLVDLKRVNHELQEENESYMILLRERTLSGLFDPMKQVGSGAISTDGDEDEDDESMSVTDDTGDVGSLRSTTTRSTLDKVEEIPEESLEHNLELSLEPQAPDSIQQPTRTQRSGRHSRGRTSSSSALGESLANLPITGPGLDLAAELGRAENKDILEGNVVEPTDRSVLNSKGKKGKKHDRRNSAEGLEPSGSTNDIDILRTEVKSLKDANKALSLYASKIIDRIISQEGFEHVLAADYDKETPTPSPAVPKSGAPSFHSSVPNIPKKPRSQSIMGLGSISNSEALASSHLPPPPTPKGTPSAANPKTQRRSMSFDWKSFSLFGGPDKREQPPNLRPLTLKPGASPLTSARKLETQEDEDDRRERERLHATMKLMGIQPTISSPLPASDVLPPPPITKSISSPASPPPQTASRFSFFSRSTTANSDASSVNSVTPSISSSPQRDQITDRPPNLTQAALEQAETENTLAALDAHERTLSTEIASGSGSGFTEIPRRGGEWRRNRRSRMSGGGSGSGSTVWSAGIGDGDE